RNNPQRWIDESGMNDSELGGGASQVQETKEQNVPFPSGPPLTRLPLALNPIVRRGVGPGEQRKGGFLGLGVADFFSLAIVKLSEHPTPAGSVDEQISATILWALVNARGESLSDYLENAFLQMEILRDATIEASQDTILAAADHYLYTLYFGTEYGMIAAA